MNNSTQANFENGPSWFLRQESLEKLDTVSVSVYTQNVTAPARLMMPLWSQFLFLTAFIVLVTVALSGNLIVIWIVMAHKRMRTVTNYFLVNLAAADTLISLLNIPFISTFLLYQNWWYGEIWCKCVNFVSICTLSASVLTLMAIAIDR